MQFDSAGVRITSGKLQLGLALRAAGYGRSLRTISPVAPTAVANRVTFTRQGLQEWYRNGPLGLEQGFTVHERPRSSTGALVLTLGISGTLRPEQVGAQILFRTKAGLTALRYGHLAAADATGQQLPARMQLRNGILLLRIDSHDARYPVRIDPFIQQGEKLSGSDEAGEGMFGHSVALSADGNTALIGAPGNNGGGAAWVFTRSGSTWTQQGEKLTGSGQVAKDEFGESVALSADGNTALIGGPARNAGSPGAAWVFARSGSTWTQQGEKLTGSDEVGEGEFGYTVALSSDGNTALIGGPTDHSAVGAVWVYIRSGETWSQEGEKLAGSRENSAGRFGYSVALSSDGDTALIGGYWDDGGVGAAWVFTRGGTTWTQQGEKLTGGQEGGRAEFGWSVALSSDGDTALVSGPAQQDTETVGAAWVFTRSGSTWTQQGERLIGTGQTETFPSEFGRSAALDGNGNIAVIGGPDDRVGAGSAWVFTRTGETWVQQGAKITGDGQNGNSLFSYGVSLSSDGSTLLIGGPVDSGIKGSAWVFTNGPTAPSTVTEAASSVTQISAILTALVDPDGEAVSECLFEYGITASYGSNVPCSSLPGSGEGSVAVSTSVDHLNEHTTYHYRIVATNSKGTSDGVDFIFTTFPYSPIALTGPALSVTQTTVVLKAEVTPEDAAVTDCKFEYGTTVSYGSYISCSSPPGSGTNAVSVEARVMGLNAGTAYHYRIVAANSRGTSNGSDETFFTEAPRPTPPIESGSGTGSNEILATAPSANSAVAGITSRGQKPVSKATTPMRSAKRARATLEPLVRKQKRLVEFAMFRIRGGPIDSYSIAKLYPSSKKMTLSYRCTPCLLIPRRIKFYSHSNTPITQVEWIHGELYTFHKAFFKGSILQVETREQGHRALRYTYRFPGNGKIDEPTICAVAARTQTGSCAS